MVNGMENEMRLKNVEIENYRCFKKATIDLDEHMTLIVGKNGAGKTAILDAVAVAASTFMLGISGAVSRSILKDDARYEFHSLGRTVEAQHQFPVKVRCVGECFGKEKVSNADIEKPSRSANDRGDRGPSPLSDCQQDYCKSHWKR